MMRSVFLTSFISLFITVKNASADDSGPEWSYTKTESSPAKWPNVYSTCGRSLQSPINLAYDKAKYAAKLGELRITGNAAATSSKYNITNNGHSVVIEFPKNKWNLTLNNGPFGTYEIKQMHFHWGSNNSLGSEHTIDEKPYAMETHIVCFQRAMYKDFKTASTHTGGLAVLGIFHVHDDAAKSNETQIGVIKTLERTLRRGGLLNKRFTFAPFEFAPLVQQLNMKHYFRYIGSLTTPPCTENVVWTVLKEPVKITTKQLSLFRKQLFGSKEDVPKMADNFRPVQPLNTKYSPWNRTLYRSWNIATNLEYSCLLVLPIIAQFIFELLHSE